MADISGAEHVHGMRRGLEGRVVRAPMPRWKLGRDVNEYNSVRKMGFC